MKTLPEVSHRPEQHWEPEVQLPPDSVQGGGGGGGGGQLALIQAKCPFMVHSVESRVNRYGKDCALTKLQNRLLARPRCRRRPGCRRTRCRRPWGKSAMPGT